MNDQIDHPDWWNLIDQIVQIGQIGQIGQIDYDLLWYDDYEDSCDFVYVARYVRNRTIRRSPPALYVQGPGLTARGGLAEEIPSAEIMID